MQWELIKAEAYQINSISFLVQHHTFSISGGEFHWVSLSRRRGRLGGQSCDVRVIPKQNHLGINQWEHLDSSHFMCKYSAKQFEKCSQGEMVGEGRQSDGRLVEPVDYVAADKKCLDKRVFSVLMCETHLKTLRIPHKFWFFIVLF